MKKKEWFASWFDTPFYHILYQNRDFDEAGRFIDCLLDNLKPKSEAEILDLACGKGRHAYFMAEKGFRVEGVDLSPDSIRSAKKHFRLDNLDFNVLDMRDKYKESQFDYVFNFFTSFGYFDSLDDNKRVIDGMSYNLKAGGTLVIDFMNAKKAIANLISEEVKALNAIIFDIKRKVENDTIIKDIQFSYKEEYHYQEKVQALVLDDFKALIEHTDLKLQNVYGDYQLNSFDEESSDRLIMVFNKQ
jgi:SAM-dependent methyltransferase